MKRYRLFSGFFLAAISLAAGAQTYRWVGEDGVTVYSQTPPPSGSDSAEVVKHRPAPKNGPADTEAATKSLNKMRQDLEDRREDRKLAKQAQDEQQQATAARLNNCEVGRSNLRNLTALGNRKLRTPDGEYLRLTEEERQTRMEQARKDIEDNCKK
ncbi:MAG: DUF4124 domain-containing protein [endosymbiont of Seepiophila jonesi]|uniref:DUF4124 domain-containing protein n=1 Tax=endosymbiont of Lamellibrachia luymesi TaxID=2200907 RepID=A0A370DXU4_9GAMM|nr:MAG: DUF4124 domain-containing protein [endosymbiont of Lamellibrachia luymesi]RDH94647.1 MAG: DUF4124 domain-containing protein [endosymbiont of Seepiophila jonesi]